MDLSTYKFPEVTEVDLAFPTFNTPKELIAEAEKRSPQKGIRKFSELSIIQSTKVNWQN
jgi:indole-3-glycerol phosphate synthase